MTRVVLATGNAGKGRELGALLAPLGLEVVLQGELGVSPVAETGLSFVENALLKARHAAAHSGLPAIADDSGLCVDCLQGAPGIHSARYGGTGASDAANVERLLTALGSHPRPWLGRFWCALVWLRTFDDPTPLIAQAAWEGEVIDAPRGEGGFGYDPVFYSPAHGVTAAELDLAAKNRCSHRGLALAALVQALERQR
ncbi:MAG: RdgB/HAM1 family non-canonical purine NTP pyrophosphatase [Candidatus Competibacterales bacterium]